jgi:hypothetical protein
MAVHQTRAAAVSALRKAHTRRPPIAPENVCGVHTPPLPPPAVSLETTSARARALKLGMAACREGREGCEQESETVLEAPRLRACIERAAYQDAERAHDHQSSVLSCEAKETADHAAAVPLVGSSLLIVAVASLQRLQLLLLGAARHVRRAAPGDSVHDTAV